MNYDQYQEMRQEYFSGKKRSGLEGKLLKKAQYTPDEQADIVHARVALKNAMYDAEVARNRWHSMLVEQTIDRDKKPIDIARTVAAARYNRKVVRARVRVCEQEYRMAWEVPFLLAQENRRSAKKIPFPPVFHNVKFDQVLLSKSTRKGPPISSLRVLERHHQS